MQKKKELGALIKKKMSQHWTQLWKLKRKEEEEKKDLSESSSSKENSSKRNSLSTFDLVKDIKRPSNKIGFVNIKRKSNAEFLTTRFVSPLRK